MCVNGNFDKHLQILRISLDKGIKLLDQAMVILTPCAARCVRVICLCNKNRKFTLKLKKMVGDIFALTRELTFGFCHFILDISKTCKKLLQDFRGCFERPMSKAVCWRTTGLQPFLQAIESLRRKSRVWPMLLRHHVKLEIWIFVAGENLFIEDVWASHLHPPPQKKVEYLSENSCPTWSFLCILTFL